MNRETCAFFAEDGTRIHAWRLEQAPHLPVCVLLHGSGDGSYVWDYLSAQLASFCTTVAMDFRGHGESERSRSGDYGVSAHVGDVERLIETHDLRSIVLCGHSLGGQVAVRIASGRLARRMAGAILVDVCPNPNALGGQQATLNMRQGLRQYATEGEYMRWLLETRPLLSSEVAKSLAHGALRQIDGGAFELKMDPRICEVRDDGNVSCTADWPCAFAAVKCQTLLMRGIASAMVSAEAARSTRNLLRDCKLVTIAHAGHAVMSDNPKDFAFAVLGFLREIAQPRLERI